MLKSAAQTYRPARSLCSDIPLRLRSFVPSLPLSSREHPSTLLAYPDLDLPGQHQVHDDQRARLALARPRVRRLGLPAGQVPQGPGERQGLLAHGRRIRVQEVPGGQGRGHDGQRGRAGVQGGRARG